MRDFADSEGLLCPAFTFSYYDEAVTISRELAAPRYLSGLSSNSSRWSDGSALALGDTLVDNHVRVEEGLEGFGMDDRSRNPR